jgi:hypothetical protein
MATTVAGGACSKADEAGDPWPPSGHWETLAPMPELPRYYCGMAAARGRLFVVGGVTTGPQGFSGPEQTAVHSYDPTSNTWERLADLPKPVLMANVAGIGDQLYVLGAMDVSESFAYDFDQRTWVAKKPLPVMRGPGRAVVGVWKTTVFLAGGAVHGKSANDLNTGERQSGLLAYETTRDEWTKLADLPVAVGYAAGGVTGDQLWVMGGSTPVARTEQVIVYDIPMATWFAPQGVTIPGKISSGATAVLRGRLFMPGGLEGTAAVLKSNTLVFDPPAAFANIAGIPTPRFGNGAATIGDRMYVAGGLKEVATDEMYGSSADLEVFIPGAAK